jgi:hypothetical protein
VSKSPDLRIDSDLFIFPRETGRDWDKELAEDVKGECEEKYGKVESIKVERESQVCYYLLLPTPTFSSQPSRAKST